MKEHSGEMSGEEMDTDRWENEGGLATQLAQAGRKRSLPKPPAKKLEKNGYEQCHAVEGSTMA
jgi:hypothetical protein